MKFIDEVTITGKRILLRVDFNVSFDAQHRILDDERIQRTLPTIRYLLEENDFPILLSHLGQPKGREETLSLRPVALRLQELLPQIKVHFVQDLSSLPIENTRSGIKKQLVLLENIRFFKGETSNDPTFAKYLASFGDVFVNDAFGVSHRKETSVVGLPSFLPSYGGLLLKKEITMIDQLLHHPTHPFVAILGGAKISTKITVIKKLMTLADSILLGGGLANTFLLAQGLQVGKSLVEEQEVATARQLLDTAQQENVALLLPTDVVVGRQDGSSQETKSVTRLESTDTIFDIGPHTIESYQAAISHGKSLLWNGPLGYFETPVFAKGTDAIFTALTQNQKATSVIGGGETLTSIAHLPGHDKITHISTGGGALLEYIANGTLPGIDALK
ncbi:MAG TPA: phosphoglycerate kinase [Patescibacteria group bacterium]|nr:phosphoglycerate kinase [Patescibacteria group bacterium]